MTRIAKRRFLRHSTSAPVVILRTVQRFIDNVGANSLHDGERVLTLLVLEAALEILGAELLDADIRISKQVGMQQAFNVFVASTCSLPSFREFLIKV